LPFDASAQPTLVEILATEIALHPALSASDVQKLIYQAVFGSDHWRPDTEGFKDRLRSEWALMGRRAFPGLLPLQVIDPEGRTARLHLGPVRAAAVPVESVVRLLVAQAPKRGAWARFERLWALAIELARQGAIPLDAGRMASLGRPELLPHHSPGYGEAAYRVMNDVTGETVRQWLASHPGLERQP
jgi:hypothetical protein